MKGQPMIQMKEPELQSILKSYGWAMIKRQRYHQKYLYAKQRQGSEIKEVYITPVSKLENLTPEEVIKKLKPKDK
jgi:hypothetical protein